MHPRSADVANVMFANPGDGNVYRARVLVQPFGSCSAPKNWGRLITCIQELAARLFRLHVGAYVDDVFTGEPSTYALSGFSAFKKLAKLLGVPTADRKDQRPAKTIRVLGAVVTVNSDGLTVCADEKRKLNNVERIDGVLASKILTPAAAGKLRGKLGFLASLAFGKVGRSMLAPLARRQYAVGKRKLSPELRNCLTWWRSQIPDLAPRFVPYDFNFRFGAHSDAQGSGHVAATFRCNGLTTVYSLHLPVWLVNAARRSELDSGIFVFEMAAALFALCLIPALGFVGSVAGMLCVDNQGVLESLIRGASGNPLASAIAAVFWNVAMRNSTFVWLERVSSSANFADQPSRLCGETGVTSSDFSRGGAPKSFLAIFSAPGNLYAAVSGTNVAGLHVEPIAWKDCV